MLLGERAEPGRIGGDLGLGEQGADLGVALAQPLELVDQGRVHRAGSRSGPDAGSSSPSVTPKSILAASTMSWRSLSPASRMPVLGAWSSLLVRDAGDVLDDLFRRLAAPQPAARLREHVLPDGVGGCTHLDDDRGHAPPPHPGHEVRDLLVDDAFGHPGRLDPPLPAFLDHVRQIVDAVQVHVREVAGVAFDVVRNGEIDHEHGAPPTLADRRARLLEGDDRHAASRGRDDDVRLGEMERHFIERDGVGTQRGRDAAGMLESPVRNDHAPDAAGCEVTRTELDRLPGTHEQGGARVEIPEDALREGHRGVGHRDRARADVGVGAHALRHRERPLEELVEHDAERALAPGQTVVPA